MLIRHLASVLCALLLLSAHAVARPAPQTFSSDGVTIAYWRIPASNPQASPLPPIYVLHGGPGFDHRYLEDSPGIQALTREREVILYDQRGVGQSSPLQDDQSCTVDDQIQDLERLRQHLGHPRIVLAGHSWGGFLAMAYVQKNPDPVSHLILIDTMPMKYEDDFSMFADIYPQEYKVMREQRMQATLRDDPEAMKKSLRAYMSMLFAAPEPRDRFIAGAADYSFNPDVSRSLNDDAWEMDLTPTMQGYSGPLLILHGYQDFNIAIGSAIQIGDAVPKALLILMEDCGHLPFYEKPDDFATFVHGFLNMP